nr:hypothetical protein CPGR_04101 [Mycolicibacterium malmesburyense]
MARRSRYRNAPGQSSNEVEVRLPAWRYRTATYSLSPHEFAARQDGSPTGRANDETRPDRWSKRALRKVVLREALSSQNTPFATLIHQGKGTLTNALRPASPPLTRDERPYRPNIRLTAAQRAQLAEQYRLGFSALDLARQYGINRHTVTKHLKRERVALRGDHTKMKPEKVALAAQLYASGHSLAEIGTHLDVHASTVHKVLKKAGVKMRDTHGRQQ